MYKIMYFGIESWQYFVDYCSFEDDPSKLTWTVTRVLLGNGHNRWYDKSMQWCISANGWGGCVFEHSWYYLF